MKFGIEQEDIKKVEDITVSLGRISDKFKQLSGVDIARISSASPRFLKAFESKLDEIISKTQSIKKIDLVSHPANVKVIESIRDSLASVGKINEDILPQLDEFVAKLNKISVASQNVAKSQEEMARVTQEGVAHVTPQRVRREQRRKHIFDKRNLVPDKGKRSFFPKGMMDKLVNAGAMPASTFTTKPIANVVKLVGKYVKNIKIVQSAHEKIKGSMEKTSAITKKLFPTLGKMANTSLVKISNLHAASRALKGIKFIANEIKQTFMMLFPIMILASLAEFVNAMLELDKSSKQLVRNFVNIAGQTSDINKFSGKGGAGFKDMMWKMNTSTLAFAKRWGITFDEAKTEIESMGGSGIKLSQILGGTVATTGGKISQVLQGNSNYSMKLADDIKTMATFSGQSMGEMTTTAIAWQNEFGVAIEDSIGLFARLKRDANKTGLVTGRYFEKVMSAASSMVVYGTRLQDVSALYSDLAKSMDLPREKAAELAKALIKGPQDFTFEQQAMISQMGKGEDELKRQLAEYNNRLLTAKGAEAEELKKRKELMESALKLDNFGGNKMAQAARIFELLDPQRILKVRLDSLKKAMGEQGKHINLFDPKDTAEWMRNNSALIAKWGQNQGFEKETALAYAAVLQGMSDQSPKLESLSKELGINSQSLMDAMLNNDPEALQNLLGPAFDKLGWDTGKIKKVFTAAGYGDLVRNIDKNGTDHKKILADMVTKLGSVPTAIAELGKDRKTPADKDAERMKSQAQQLADNTYAIRDMIGNEVVGVQMSMLKGIQGIFQKVSGLWQTAKTMWAGLQMSSIFKYFVDQDKLDAISEKEKANSELDDKISEIQLKLDRRSDLSKSLKSAKESNSPEMVEHYQKLLNAIEGEESLRKEQFKLIEKKKKNEVAIYKLQTNQIKANQQTAKDAGEQGYKENSVGQTAGGNVAVANANMSEAKPNTEAGKTGGFQIGGFKVPILNTAAQATSERRLVTEELVKKLGGNDRKKGVQLRAKYGDINTLNDLQNNRSPKLSGVRDSLNIPMLKLAISQNKKKKEEWFGVNQDLAGLQMFFNTNDIPAQMKIKTDKKGNRTIDIDLDSSSKIGKTELQKILDQKSSQLLKDNYKIGKINDNQKLMADGGIVLPRYRGTNVTVGEAGQPEAIIPLDKLNTVFGRYIQPQNRVNSMQLSLENLLKTISSMKIELSPNELKINIPSVPTSTAQNVYNQNQNTTAPTTNNFYNNVTIPVKSGDPRIIEQVVRQVLYERDAV